MFPVFFMMLCSLESTGQMSYSDRGNGMDFNEVAYRDSFQTYPTYINSTADSSHHYPPQGNHLLNAKYEFSSDCLYQTAGKKWTSFILFNFVVMFVLPIMVSVAYNQKNSCA